MYEDKSALYNKAQSHAMPVGGFQWASPESAEAIFKADEKRLRESGLSAADFFDGKKFGCTYMVDLDFICRGYV